MASVWENNIIRRQKHGLLNNKVGSKDIWIFFYENHGLTALEICKFFDNNKMIFLWSKKSHFEKTTKVILQKSRLERNVEFLTRIMGYPFGNMQIFRLQ